MELFPYVCTTGVYTIKICLMNPLVKYLRRCGDLPVLEASFYEQFNFHIKNAYLGLSRRRSTAMKETVTLIKSKRCSK